MPVRLTETAIARAAREAAETGRRRDLADDFVWTDGNAHGVEIVDYH